jgi:hypothetical protein
VPTLTSVPSASGTRTYCAWLPCSWCRSSCRAASAAAERCGCGMLCVSQVHRTWRQRWTCTKTACGCCQRMHSICFTSVSRPRACLHGWQSAKAGCCRHAGVAYGTMQPAAHINPTITHLLAALVICCSARPPTEQPGSRVLAPACQPCGAAAAAPAACSKGAHHAVAHLEALHLQAKPHVSRYNPVTASGNGLATSQQRRNL